ncbi:hypothetical protein SXCC_01345 [Gluconacetobacter sp. SXCC-1]|nr:hypothetical protein SXCC_01345 [Gluconacetobacter sp. SXCC-1]
MVAIIDPAAQLAVKVGTGAATTGRSRLVHRDPLATTRQFNRRRQARQPAAYNMDMPRHAASARQRAQRDQQLARA